jgi:hypothetical protein
MKVGQGSLGVILEPNLVAAGFVVCIEEPCVVIFAPVVFQAAPVIFDVDVIFAPTGFACLMLSSIVSPFFTSSAWAKGQNIKGIEIIIAAIVTIIAT